MGRILHALCTVKKDKIWRPEECDPKRTPFSSNMSLYNTPWGKPHGLTLWFSDNGSQQIYCHNFLRPFLSLSFFLSHSLRLLLKLPCHYTFYNCYLMRQIALSLSVLCCWIRLQRHQKRRRCFHVNDTTTTATLLIWVNYGLFSLSFILIILVIRWQLVPSIWAFAQLPEQMLETPDVCDSNPIIGKMYLLDNCWKD